MTSQANNKILFPSNNVARVFGKRNQTHYLIDGFKFLFTAAEEDSFLTQLVLYDAY